MTYSVPVQEGQAPQPSRRSVVYIYIQSSNLVVHRYCVENKPCDCHMYKKNVYIVEKWIRL